MRRQKTWRPLAALFVLAAVTVGVLSPATAGPRPRVTDEIQFLTISDWHGQLDPLSVFGVGEVGGAAALSTYWEADRAEIPATLTLTAGDDFGASPPLSNFFDEIPAVLGQNLIGIDAGTLGNHNFDQGIDHLQQMIDIADYPYVSANLDGVHDNLDGVEPFQIFDVGGVFVAVIGVTNPEAPELVFPGSFGTIEVTDPVEAAMRARRQAERAGADVFVLLAHMGVTGFDDHGRAQGPLIDLAEGVRGFDFIFGDHTDVQYAGWHNGALVVQNRSKGRTYARVEADVKRRGERVWLKKPTVEFVVPFSGAVTPDATIEALLAPYREDLAAALDGVIGVATDTFPRGGGYERLGEAELGDLVADSMRLRYGTQLAFTNAGGIRSPLPSSYAPQDTTLARPAAGYAAGPPWDLVVGDAFTILPFGNSIVTRTVTGAQLWDMLENGFSRLPDANGRFPQISGFVVAYDSALPPGSRVVSVTLPDGTPIVADGTSYTIAVNDFINSGGDGYTMLADGEGTSRELMATVFAEYVESQGVVTPTLDGRLTDANPPPR